MSIQTRHLTRSGLPLSVLGLGCATLVADPAPAAISDARQVLANAQEAGISYFDTAPLYGKGLSERLVGDALRGAAGRVLSTKVGRILEPDSSAPSHMPFCVAFDYSYDGIMRSVEHSFQRLGLSKIDIAYAHDLGRHTHGDDAGAQYKKFFEGGGYRALDTLRRSGDIAAIGLGVNEVQVCQDAMNDGEFDLFLLAGRYTLLERTGALSFFEDCAAAGTDIVIGGPFNSGLLVGGSTYNYLAIPEEIGKRHGALVEYCAHHKVEIGAAALQFPLRHRGVKSVVPGPKTPAELSQILNWMDAEISQSFWDNLSDLEQ